MPAFKGADRVASIEVSRHRGFGVNPPVADGFITPSVSQIGAVESYVRDRIPTLRSGRGPLVGVRARKWQRRIRLATSVLPHFDVHVPAPAALDPPPAALARVRAATRSTSRARSARNGTRSSRGRLLAANWTLGRSRYS